MVVEQQKPENPAPKTDYKQVAKNYAVGYGSYWLSTVILLVPVVTIYIIAYFALIKTGLYLTFLNNVRGIVVFVVVFAPLLLASVAHHYVRQYLYEKWQK